MKLIIERVNNGFILISEDLPLEKGEDSMMDKNVLEEDDNDELKVVEHLLYRVMEEFGLGGSKHDLERIRVIREKQNGE